MIQRDQKTVLREILDILEQEFRVQKVSGETLIEDLPLDSLDLVELALVAEETFSIGLADADLQQCKTVQDVVELIVKAPAEE